MHIFLSECQSSGTVPLYLITIMQTQKNLGSAELVSWGGQIYIAWEIEENVRDGKRVRRA